MLDTTFPTILIVDDTPVNLGVTAEGLEARGFRVLVAEDGEEGFARAQLVHPDLIVLDVMLQGESGFKVCQRLKAHPATQDIPVIFATALTDAGWIAEGFKVGGADYILKPLHLDEMVIRINNHLNLRAMQSQLETQNAQLRQYREELEKKVVERTAELSESNRLLREEISERKRVEMEFRTLAEHSPSTIVRYDRDCRRIYVNPEYSRRTGITPSQAHDEISSVQLSEAVLHEYQVLLRRVMDTGESAQTILEWMCPNDGMVVSSAVHVVAERGPDGQVTGVLAIGHDITEVQSARRALEQSHEQLHELAARLDSAQEDERKSIARELHDELGQLLTMLRLDISMIRLEFGKGNPALQERVTKLEEMVDRNIRAVREIVTALRPSALDMGIVPALEWLADEFVGHAEIPCKLRVDEDIRIDGHRATAIFRIVQESLTNIVRHAEAKQVNILLERNNTDYVLQVRDDGCGFDVSDIARKSAFGLVGLRERVHGLGGKIDVASRLGQGTVLTVHIPQGRDSL